MFQIKVVEFQQGQWFDFRVVCQDEVKVNFIYFNWTEFFKYLHLALLMEKFNDHTLKVIRDQMMTQNLTH